MKNKRKMKYQPSDYHLIVFSKVGAKVATSTYPSFTQAKEAGDELDNDMSFCVSHIMYNSLVGKKDKWGHE